MKKITYLYSALLLLLIPGGQLKATHLEGLWRNDRQNITIRIEDNRDGFRARRLDQGIWYTYLAQDGHHYYDRYGNYYEIGDDNEITWNETASGKRIRFSRVDSRGYDYHNDYGYRSDSNDDQWGEWNEHSDGYFDSNQRWENHWIEDQHRFPDGRYMESNRRSEIEIEWFRGGIRVKRAHGGWAKYYPDRHGSLYKDCDGNILQLFSHDAIRWTSDDGRWTRIYYKCH